MIHKGFRFLLRFLSIVSIISMVSFIALITWVVVEPKPLKDFEPYIKEELNAAFDGYEIDFESSYIKWNPYEKAINIFIANTTIKNDQGEQVAILPETYFNFSVIRFLEGRFLSSDVHIYNPSVYLNVSHFSMPEGTGIEGAIDSSNALKKSSVFWAGIYKKIATKLEGYSPNVTFEEIRLFNADLFLRSDMSNIVWTVKEGTILAQEHLDRTRVTADLMLDLSGIASRVVTDVQLLEDNKKSLSFEWGFENFSSLVVNDIFPDVAFLKKFMLEGDGQVRTLLYPDGHFSEVDVTLEDMKGLLDFPEYFPKEVHLDNLYSSIRFDENGHYFRVKEHKMKVDGIESSFSLDIDNFVAFMHKVMEKGVATLKDEEQEKFSLKMTAIASKLNVKKLGELWPKTAISPAREWVFRHITKGDIERIQSDIYFTQDDFDALDRWHKEIKRKNHNGQTSLAVPLNDNALSVSIEADNLDIDYHPDFPKVTNATSHIKFTGSQMIADISSADILSSKIDQAKVTLEDLWQSPIRIGIDASVEGKLNDYAAFLHPAVEKNNSPTLQSLIKSNGELEGKVSLSFLGEKGLPFDDIDLTIDAIAKDVVLPSLIKKKDVRSPELKVSFADKVVTVQGITLLDQVKADIFYQQSFASRKPEFPINYQVKTTVSSDQLRALNIADIPFIDDEFFVEANVKESATKRNITLQGDITDTLVEVPMLFFQKKKGQQAHFTSELVVNIDGKKKDSLKGASIEVKNFALEGQAIDIKGKFSVVNNVLTALNIQKGKYGKNDYKLRYAKKKGVNSIDLSGRQIHLMDFGAKKFVQKEKNTPKNNWFDSIDFNTTLNHLIIGDAYQYDQVAAYLNCYRQQCKKIQFFAELPEKKGFATIDIKPLNNTNSTVLIESDNAGYVLGSLGITQNIESGRLLVQAATDFPNQGNAQTKGVLKLSNFTAKKTPILGRLLTLASLQGISDLLNNKGISFSKFEAPFTFSDYIITVNNARSSGASLGITAEGTIDVKQEKLDLTGTVIPAQQLNKILSSIPIVGKLIGGKEQSIIATRYSVKGSFDDTKINVNPLSIFTPGVLRNLFDFSLTGKEDSSKSK